MNLNDVVENYINGDNETSNNAHTYLLTLKEYSIPYLKEKLNLCPDLYKKYFLWQLLFDLKSKNITKQIISEIKKTVGQLNYNKIDVKDYILNCLEILEDHRSNEFKFLLYSLFNINDIDIRLKALKICSKQINSNMKNQLELFLNDNDKDFKRELKKVLFTEN